MNPLRVSSDPEHPDAITVMVERTGYPRRDPRHVRLPALANDFPHTRLPGIERMFA